MHHVQYFKLLFCQDAVETTSRSHRSKLEGICCTRYLMCWHLPLILTHTSYISKLIFVSLSNDANGGKRFRVLPDLRFQKLHVSVQQGVGGGQYSHRLHPGSTLHLTLNSHVLKAGQTKHVLFAEIPAVKNRQMKFLWQRLSHKCKMGPIESLWCHLQRYQLLFLAMTQQCTADLGSNVMMSPKTQQWTADLGSNVMMSAKTQQWTADLGSNVMMSSKTQQCTADLGSNVMMSANSAQLT